MLELFFQNMPHVAQEANMMRHNLIPYLRQTIGDDILPYFRSEAIKATETFTWDPDNHRVICPTDINMEQEEDDDTLGLAEAFNYVEAASKEQSTAKPPPTPSQRPPPQAPNPSSHLNPHEEANAYYKDDDSLSTISNSLHQQPLRPPATQPSSTSNLAASNVFMPQTVGTVGNTTSVSSGITMESFQNVINEQKCTAQVLDAILARLPPPQTSQLAGNIPDQNAGGAASTSGAGL